MSKMPIKYYLCGPIDTAGTRELNVLAFANAVLDLRRQGYDIISPLDIDPYDLKLEYMDYIRKDIKALVDCQAIILLPGWPQSKGARNELIIAMQLNMKVYYYCQGIIDMNF